MRAASVPRKVNGDGSPPGKLKPGVRLVRRKWYERTQALSKPSSSARTKWSRVSR